MRKGSPFFYDPKFRANRVRGRVEELLGDWYGEDFALERVTGFGEAPRPVGAVIQELLREKLSAAQQLDMAIRESWESLIGAPLNRLTAFVRREENCVVVEVAHPAFLRELNRPQVIAEWCAKLNRQFPGAEVDSVRFIPASEMLARRK